MFAFIVILAAINVAAAKNLVAVTAIGGDSEIVVESFLHMKTRCPADNDTELVIVTNDTCTWNHHKDILCYKLLNTTLDFIARFETYTWSLIRDYEKVIQLDADVVINNCLSFIFDQMDSPRALYAHPASYEKTEQWSLEGYAPPSQPFNTNVVAYSINGFMLMHMEAMTRWTRDELEFVGANYEKDSFVNVYANGHGLVNVTGAITYHTIIMWLAGDYDNYNQTLVQVIY